MKYELKMELETNNKKLIELLWDNFITNEEFNQEEDNININGNEAVNKIIEELTQPLK